MYILIIKIFKLKVVDFIFCVVEVWGGRFELDVEEILISDYIFFDVDSCFGGKDDLYNKISEKLRVVFICKVNR